MPTEEDTDTTNFRVPIDQIMQDYDLEILDDGVEESVKTEDKGSKKGSSEPEDSDFDLEFEAEEGEDGDDLPEDVADVYDDDDEDRKANPVDEKEDNGKKQPSNSKAEKRIKNLIEKLKEISKQRDEAEAALINERISNKSTAELKEAAYGAEALRNAEYQEQIAKTKYRQAVEMGDIDAQIEANEALLEAKVAVKEAKAFVEKYKGVSEKTETININPVLVARQRNVAAWAEANQHVFSMPQLKTLVASYAAEIEAEGYGTENYDYFSELNKRVNNKLKEVGIKGIKVVDIYGNDEDDDEDETPTSSTVKDINLNKITSTTTKTPKPVNPVSYKTRGPNVPKMKRESMSNMQQDGEKGRKIQITRKEADEISRLGLNPKDVLKQRAYGERNANPYGFQTVFIPQRGGSSAD